jgi:hypothetical protein
MAENAESILREIKARKQAKKQGIGTREEVRVETPTMVEIKNISENKDLKEIALRIEGKKNN